MLAFFFLKTTENCGIPDLVTDYQIHHLGNPSRLPENFLKIHPCDSRVFHDCYDNNVKSTTEPCQYSEMLHIYAASVALSVCVNSYFPPQPHGANFEADMLSHIIRRAGISQSPHSANNDNYMNWPMTR